MTTYTILFIDDDPDIRRLLGAHFESLGHSVHLAGSGEEGVKLFRKVGPDVTVVDLMLPGMSGLDVLRTLRQQRAIVIMLTVRDEVSSAVEAMRLGAETFLVKGPDLDHLEVAIDRAGEKALLRAANARLEAQLRPSLGKRLRTAGMAALLIGGALSAGLLIGREPERERPVPRLATRAEHDTVAANVPGAP